MKSIMLSIQPKYCELIASGKKTIEVRKTAPKLETPFKCYIYCTGGVGKEVIKNIVYRWNGTRLIKRHVDKGWLKDRPEQTWQILLDYGFTHPIHNGDYELNGKVIGEFVCDTIDKYEYSTIDGVDIDDDELLETMLDREEINIYANGKDTYGLHIADLKIYDKPKELGEFRKPCPFPSEDCDLLCPHALGEYHGDGINGDVEFVGCGNTLTHPPQSWCYVEEL